MNEHRSTRRIDDAVLDAALAAIVRVGPSPGLRRRVTARLDDTSRPPVVAMVRRPVRVIAWAAALATILAVFWIARPGVRPGPLPAAPVLAVAATLPVPSVPDDPRPAASFRVSTRAERSPSAEPWHAALPPLETPGPLGIDPLGAPATVDDPIVIEPLAIDSLRIDTLD